MRSQISSDPFGTAELRRAVLDAWSASPARFREDANTEEELVRGAYRDRVVVELAQNAADAARRQQVPGRLLLKLDGGVLRAANTGAALDSPGVVSLSSLRASAKRDDAETVGRFGVGFAAVLAVTDEPAVISRTGGVRWSRSEAVAIAASLPALEGELARRGTAVPVLRLPFPTSGDVPAGYDTEVRLPLRDQAAHDLVRRLVSTVDDGLLLALPGLDEVILDMDGRHVVLSAERTDGEVVVSDGNRRTRWRLAERTGEVPAHLLADRPIEEPDRWAVTVAVPLDDTGAPAELPASVPRVVHAPTPTDDRTALPVLVLAGFPLDSSRRRIVPGPLTDLLVAEVAIGYSELAAELAVASGAAVLGLTPDPLPVGELDALLHEAIVAALARTPLVAPALGQSVVSRLSDEPASDPRRNRLAPRDVVLVDGLVGAADPAALAPFLPGLPDPAWRSEALRRLGAHRVGLGEVIDGLGGLTMEPVQWRALYAALDGADREALATLPVPLADGRVVRGARGVLLPSPGLDAAALAPLGLRVAAAEAAHPLLVRLGAQEATAATVLRHPLVRMAVEAGDESVSDAVLQLVASSGMTVDDEPWLAEVRLPDGAGSPVAAGDLYLPGSPVLPLLDVDPAEYAVSGSVVARWGTNTLLAVGVRAGFAVRRLTDVVLGDDVDYELDDEAAWIDAALAELPEQDLPPVIPELSVIQDLDLVHDERWPSVLTLLAADAGTRPALVAPVHAVLTDGSRRAVRSYSSWWLRTHARIAGHPLNGLSAADAEPLVQQLFPAVPVELDARVAGAVGLHRTVADLVREPDVLLGRLAAADVELTVAQLAELYAALVAAGPDPGAVEPPALIRVPVGSGTTVVDAADVVVASGPHWLQLDLPAAVPGVPELADLLDVPLASERYDPTPDPSGVVTPVPPVVRQLVPGVPDSYVEHDELTVAGRPVDWWIDDEGTVHASTADGLARGLAWTSGHWAARLEVAEALRDPGVVSSLLADRAFPSAPSP